MNIYLKLMQMNRINEYVNDIDFYIDILEDSLIRYPLYLIDLIVVDRRFIKFIVLNAISSLLIKTTNHKLLRSYLNDDFRKSINELSDLLNEFLINFAGFIMIFQFCAMQYRAYCKSVLTLKQITKFIRIAICQYYQNFNNEQNYTPNADFIQKTLIAILYNKLPDIQQLQQHKTNALYHCMANLAVNNKS
jgi:hypothetical protein